MVGTPDNYWIRVNQFADPYCQSTVTKSFAQSVAEISFYCCRPASVLMHLVQIRFILFAARLGHLLLSLVVNMVWLILGLQNIYIWVSFCLFLLSCAACSRFYHCGPVPSDDLIFKKSSWKVMYSLTKRGLKISLMYSFNTAISQNFIDGW